MKITAVILAKNEEKNIERVLKSVSFCDEILVIDDASTDKTTLIADQYKASIITSNLNNNYSEQRNKGLVASKNTWVLFVDADEEVTTELTKEIKEAIETNEIKAYYLRRRDFWWGKELKYGETSTVRSRGLLRLVNKTSGEWKGTVHEVFQTQGPTRTLNNFINHYPHPTLKSFLEEINLYSSIRAKELVHQKKQVSTFSIIMFPLSKFILNYFIELGFVDGAQGFAYAFIMSFHSFLVRAKQYQYLHFHEK